MSLGLLGSAYLTDSSEDEEENEAIKDTPVDGEGHKRGGGEVTELPLANPFMAATGANWLPKPSFLQETERVAGVRFSNSVFCNPFRDREDKKAAILEQHVEMTAGQQTGRTIDGKKVCWNFRKGRCRHGHKCSFAHDNDIKSSLADKLYIPKYDSGAQISHDKSVKDSSVAALQMEPERRVPSEVEGEEGEEQRRKKRPGLSDDLKPGKKVMKFHNRVYKDQ